MYAFDSTHSLYYTVFSAIKYMVARLVTFSIKSILINKVKGLNQITNCNKICVLGMPLVPLFHSAIAS